MTTPNPHRERDEAAEASVTRYNHKDPWVQYEMRKCGKLSFVQGWSAALANDPCVRALVDLVEDYKCHLNANGIYSSIESDIDNALAAYREKVK